MQRPDTLPTLLIAEGARRMALAHLKEASAARVRLDDDTDREALHDYRVALRRLRSCLRAYRRPLRSTVTGKSMRRLRRLACGTNECRDLEVHIGWLQEQLERADDRERPGIAGVLERLAAAETRARQEMRRRDARLFPDLQEALTGQLSAFRARIRLDPDGRRSTAAVAARRILRAGERLRRRLRGVFDYSDTRRIHRARIAAKRLRYLLEPFAEHVPEGPAVVDRLKSLQDGFGDVHDSHVFLAQLDGQGLEGLRASLRARGRRAYDQAASVWLGRASGEFFRSLEPVAAAVAELAGRDREVERKFLLTGLPPLERAEGPVEIEQGYLPGERLVERLRRIRSGSGEELVRTVKEGSGLSRLEVEEPVSAELFDRFWPLTEGRRLRKRRYRIAEGELTWEIDEFLDRDLVLAEVELGDGPAEVEIPQWLRSHLDREVTEDSAYSNVRLASARD